ncbi:hypothetical protein OGAPHI_001336 [Ogataea philodendri]|uniref:Zn(2)-C6 fungal-type domain-containing protein n=1 Tax=Ogataea philodendri TaxID=1378263 RepID=A0A9P8T8H7_9ASCO|nr:uncharacterized protein OGAPHI_001336 [Ogataea philodendri]KAH3669215.1 hypothetical protein OGAPHI_001336 [Ogataea philodendri]
MISANRTVKGGSCLPCRLKKLKCNQELPCGSCVRRNTQADCQKNPPKAWISRIHKPSKHSRTESSKKRHPESIKVIASDCSVQKHIKSNSLASISARISGSNSTSSWVLYLVRLLPCKVDCDILVGLYLKNIHGLLWAIDEQQFRETYHLFWENTLRVTSLMDLAMIFAMLCAVSTALPRQVATILSKSHVITHNYTNIWYRACKQSIRSYELDRNPTEKQISVFLILQYCYLSNGDLFALRSYLGETVTACYLTGLHLESNDLSDKEMESRKQLWWNVFYIDTLVSFYTELPPFIKCKNSNCTTPDYREQNTPHVVLRNYNPASSPMLFSGNFYLTKLMKIANSIWDSHGNFCSSKKVIDAHFKILDSFILEIPWFLKVQKDKQLPEIPVYLQPIIYWSIVDLWSKIYLIRFKYSYKTVFESSFGSNTFEAIDILHERFPQYMSYDNLMLHSQTLTIIAYLLLASLKYTKTCHSSVINCVVRSLETQRDCPFANHEIYSIFRILATFSGKHACAIPEKLWINAGEMLKGRARFSQLSFQNQ